MRPQPDDIEAPPFAPKLPWINSGALRMHQQRGRPVLVEIWDFARVNSLRTLPYVKGWHERYEERGLRVVGVQCGAWPFSRDAGEVRAAVERLGVPYPVVVDENFETWDLYGNAGWPARYLWNPENRLDYFHYGEGAYAETEEAIQLLLGIEGEPTLLPVRGEDEPGALLPAQTEDQAGEYSGPYEAGGVWAVLEGRGEARANRRTVEVSYSGCHALIEHDRHTRGELELEVGDGVVCHAVCFTPGLE
ncbi:MAG: redoxin domain-containing protein [Solirubrobacteraceae bacterium]